MNNAGIWVRKRASSIRRGPQWGLGKVPHTAHVANRKGHFSIPLIFMEHALWAGLGAIFKVK